MRRSVASLIQVVEVKREVFASPKTLSNFCQNKYMTNFISRGNSFSAKTSLDVLLSHYLEEYEQDQEYYPKIYY